MQGACGYGYIKKNEWPYWSVGAMTPGNRFAKAGPAHACGYAVQKSPATDCVVTKASTVSSPIAKGVCKQAPDPMRMILVYVMMASLRNSDTAGKLYHLN